MTCLHLPPVPASAGAARRWAAPLLPPDVRDPVVLVLSELVANAVAADTAAGATGDIEVEVLVDSAAGHVSIAVTDGSDQPLPEIPATAAADQDSGRGLLLLDALAFDHGWTSRTCGGKCVWALFSCLAAKQRWAIGSPERLECADVC